MAEAEDTAGSVVGDWRSLFSSPRGLYSALLPEYSAPFSPLRSLSSQDFPSLSEGKSWEGGALGGGSGWRGSQQQSGRSGGSFVERKAARCGFSAPRINTVRFRSVSPLASPGVRSPYITIPPGLSPTTLLDSPVMLHSSQGQLSPTTGTFPLPPCDQGHPVAMPVGSNKEKHKAADTDDSPFVFKPHSDFNSLPVLSSKQNQAFPTSGGAQLRTMADANNQSGTHAKPPLAVDCCTGLIKEGSSNNFNTERCVVTSSDGCTANAKYMESLSCPPGVSDQTQTQNVDPLNAGEDTSSQQNGEDDQKEGLSSMGLGRPSEDGYSWRKYGQKQVKGSEYPRSYYKCTHQNCPVKKKVERSLDGQITEIIYKEAHNHAKPQLNRRTSPGSIFSVGLSEYAREENGSVWKGLQPENKDHRSSGDWKGDGMERSTSALTELSEPLSTAHGKHLGVLESADTPELSSTLASHDVDEDEATQRSPSHGDDGDDDDESELKRRKKESCFMEANLAARAIREPRVVVQTDSEVDILDDGYRWRKYGQKVVKGNPNPRSYYKCTSAGCSVRKHVERASHDLKFVITTYEGKHNHEVPVARNSSHLNNGNGNDRPSSSTQSFPPLSGSDNIPKPEQFQGLAPQFERKPELSSDFLKHGCLSSYSSDRNFGSMYYDMKLPPSLHTSIPFGSFGHSRALHPPSFTHVIPDHPLSSSNLEMRPPASLPLAGFECNLSKPMDMYQPLLLHHAKEVDLRFLAPKQEKDDGAYETQLPSSHAGNAPYSQIMGRYPR